MSSIRKAFTAHLPQLTVLSFFTCWGFLLVGCVYVTSVKTVRMTAAETAAIKSVAVSILDFGNTRVEADVNSPYQPVDYYPELSFGANLAHGLISGFFSAMEAAEKELKLERELGSRVNALLLNQEWDFKQVFLNTFMQELLDGTSVDSVFVLALGDTPSTESNVDAVLKVGIAERGLDQIEADDYAVYLQVTIEVMNVVSNKTIASHTVRFDYKEATHLRDRIYHEWVRRQLRLERSRRGSDTQPTYVEFIQTVPRADSLFSIPLTLAKYEEFVADDTRLLRRELKISALQASRSLIRFLGFYNKSKRTLDQEESAFMLTDVRTSHK